jgi:hypothetical protein
MRLISLPGMKGVPEGRWVGLSLPRRFVCDLLHFARKVPSIPMQRRMQLGELLAARRTVTPRVSWCAMFVKAYSIVCAERPELRRAYMPFVLPHLYEHPEVVASFSLERDYRGEDGVFFTQVRQPQRLSLWELDAIVRSHKTAPIESVPSFRRAMLLSRFPRPLRRLVWRLGLFADGAHRANFFGTFGISVVASLGAAGLHILSPLTTTINYGAFEDDGAIDVRLTYDHRVMDGANAARAIAALEAALLGPVLAELRAGPPMVTPSIEEAELEEPEALPRRMHAVTPV